MLFRSFAAFASASALLLGGCSSRERPVEAGIRDGVLHFNNSTEPADLDPQTVTGQPEHRLVMALMEGLTDYDPVTVLPVPGAAERWELSPDRRTYTFHLRENGRWSNGDPVTAQDFLDSWKRILTPSLGAEYAYMLFYVAGAEDYYAGKLQDFSEVGFKVLDAHTLEVRLREPTPFFLSLLSHQSWMPVHFPTVEKFGGLDRKGTAWTRPENYVGNGPFVLEEWQPQQRIIVTKSPTYWDRENVRLNSIVFYPVENQDTEERMFRAGQLHVTSAVPLSKIDAYKANNPELIHIHPFLGTMYLRVNVTRPAMADARVRRALALAIDRVLITTKVNRSGKIPAYAFTPPGAAGFVAPEGFSDDAEEARRLLAAAGHAGGAGLPHIDMLYPTSQNGQLIAEAIQEMWRVELGIEVRLQNEEWKVYLDSMNTLNYDLAISVWVGDFPDPHTFLDMMVTDGGNNRTGWSNPEYDRLVGEALAAPDEPARLSIYTKLETILAEEAPVLPVYFYSSVELIHPAVRGWNPTILDVHPYKHVWLEKAEAPR